MALVLSTASYADEEHSIPADEIKKEEIFAGNPLNFAKPAEIDMKVLIMATPEYQEIKKKKIEKGTGKYWILFNHATERAHKAIKELIKEDKYDLLTNEGYLDKLTTPIKCENITKKALKILKSD